MKLIRGFSRSAIVLTAVGTMAVGGLSFPTFAQEVIEQPPIRINDQSERDEQQTAVELLEQIRIELSDEALAAVTPEDVSVIADYVDTLLTDAISQIESLTNIASDDFQNIDLNEAIETLTLASEVEALLHLLITKNIINNEDVDADALSTASAHIERAISLLNDATDDDLTDDVDVE